jgi:hypothetical protein
MHEFRSLGNFGPPEALSSLELEYIRAQNLNRLLSIKYNDII